MTICNFRQLRELDLVTSWPSKAQKIILSSTTSIELRKIIIRARCTHDWETFQLQVEAWALIDEQSCGLVDWLRAVGYPHTLEVELRLSEIRGVPRKYGFATFLPKFMEKGVVTITHGDHDTRLLYSSAHDR